MITSNKIFSTNEYTEVRKAMFDIYLEDWINIKKAIDLIDSNKFLFSIVVESSHSDIQLFDSDDEIIEGYTQDCRFIIYNRGVSIHCYDKYSSEVVTIDDILPVIKHDIDSESLSIYIDNTPLIKEVEEKEYTHIAYWHIDEVKEDETISINMLQALDILHRNPFELMAKLKFNQTINHGNTN